MRSHVAPIRILPILAIALPLCFSAGYASGQDAQATIERVKKSVVPIGTYERTRTPPFATRTLGRADRRGAQTPSRWRHAGALHAGAALIAAATDANDARRLPSTRSRPLWKRARLASSTRWKSRMSETSASQRSCLTSAA